MHAVERLRDTLRSEHSFSFQVLGATALSRPLTCLQGFLISACFMRSAVVQRTAAPATRGALSTVVLHPISLFVRCPAIAAAPRCVVAVRSKPHAGGDSTMAHLTLSSALRPACS